MDAAHIEGTGGRQMPAPWEGAAAGGRRGETFARWAERAASVMLAKWTLLISSNAYEYGMRRHTARGGQKWFIRLLIETR